MSNLNKHLLLFLAVLFVFLLVPTAFASNIDDSNLVDVNNQLAVEDVSLSETNDVIVESVSQSAADEGQSASDGSDVLEANDYENDAVTAANDAIYVDGFDGSGGSGTSGNPYHSLKNVLNSSDLSNQIYLLPGTYDFGGTTVGLYEKDFTLNAMGDVIFTSSETLFNKYGNDTLTLKGIQFRDITSSSSVILYTGSSVEGTLILNDCSFINNKGANLINTAYNVFVKGCTFINNEATGTTIADGGLIENIFGSPIINISCSVFIDNKIRYSNNGFNPIIVNGIGNSNPSVYFDYNFVNNNNPLTQDEIIANGGTLNSYSGVSIAAAAPIVVSSGSTVDLTVNFTKSDGSALNRYMPNLNVALVPAVNVGSIPVTITNNGGKGQYTAENRGYTESVDVKYGDYVLTTFEFYVSDGGLLNPEFNVPESLIVDIGATVNIDPVHIGNGAISYASADESVVTVDANGVVTGVGEGITTITVTVAATDTYGADTKQVTLMVKDPADTNAIYVDGFDESDSGSGIKVDPYHSLKNVLVSENSGKEIKLLPGTYDFASTIDMGTNTFVLTAVGDVIFTTSKDYMFRVSDVCTVTFNGIKFKDSTVDGSVITRTFSSAVGTLNFYHCDFINNTGDCLIKSSCNLNIKGCAFIDNKATGTGLSNAGLIHNYYASTNTISITYSVFVNNEITYSNNGYNPIVVDWNNGNGPAVTFNYTFVNDNNQVNDNAIAYHARITKGDNAIIKATAPSGVSAGRTVNLVVNFTKSNGNPLDEYMANLTVSLVPSVKTGSIPVTITNNGGKGKYTAKMGNPYRETVAVKVNDNDVTTFGFYVNEFRYINTSIAADDLVMSYKDGSAWVVTLTDEDGNAIAGGAVKVGIYGKLYNRVTDADGVARLV
ncbi:Ig-like domain-containing protein, partial [Methanobrevibacter sp.]|uniref:Ig-like domain-containing protein n=1 Tax=Methanobrevibacter sp. TaxID=66852 RepID=UPI00386F1E22